MTGRKRSIIKTDESKRARVDPSIAQVDTPRRTRSSSRTAAQNRNSPPDETAHPEFSQFIPAAQYNESSRTLPLHMEPRNTTSPRCIMNASTSEFGKVIKQRGFIDKSLLLNLVLPQNQEEGAEIFIVTEPRRFGKSTILSMVITCLDMQPTPLRNTEEFRRLKIMDDQYAAKRDQYFGKCPIIFLNLLCTATFTDQAAALQFVKSRIHEAYKTHKYLYKDESSDALEADEKELCKHWCERKYRQLIDNSEVNEGLKKLSEYLERYHGRKPYLLIDEYDNMISKSLSDKTGHQFEIAMEIFHNLMTEILKDNPHLEGALVTGILPIHDGSHFNKFYGLTTLDLNDLETNLQNGTPSISVSDEELEIIKSAYNGYFSREGLNVYGIWSVEKYIAKGKLEAETFWVDSGYVTNFKVAFKSYSLKNVLESLLRGDHIALDVMQVFSEEDLLILATMKTEPADVSEELFLSFLFHQGYLSYVDETPTHIKIPNTEIKTMFVSKITEFYKTSLTKEFLSAAAKESPIIFQVLQNGVYGSDSVFEESVGNAKKKLQMLFEKFSAICIKMNEPFIHIFMGQIVAHAGNYVLGPEIYVERKRNTKARLDHVVVETTEKKFAVIFEYQHDKGQFSNGYHTNAHGSLKKCIVKNYSNVFNNSELYPPSLYNIEQFILAGVSINDMKKVSLKCIRKGMDLSRAVFMDYEI
ncbi:uncharacterized protein LOC116166613 isoform X2 [Photinus pyralis]|uniref:uncharacterized protein LOC116166613 isoform X2 n=1 Tax=Photinus pyralis TaxID=7054 RepID=UPI0012671520|nr:uncharacterized protein LOC116166613 isoform X2 [Photinus pyralis]